MTKQPSPTSTRDEYQHTAEQLIDQYAPTARRACDITDWPDEISDGNLVIYDKAIDQARASINFDQGPDDRAYLTIPSSYTRPLHREPFATIDDPATLSEAGKLIYEAVELIDWIVMSPHPELTDRRQLAAVLRQLHEQYGYPPATIRTELVEAAQHRSDLPQTTG